MISIQVSKKIDELSDHIEGLRKELNDTGMLSEASVESLNRFRIEIMELRKIQIFQAVERGSTMSAVAEFNDITVSRVSQICKEMREKSNKGEL